MEHPFITNISEKSLEEIQTTISELTNKMNFAYRTGNGTLIRQIQMALESYKNEYNKKINELIGSQKINAQIKIDNKK